MFTGKIPTEAMDRNQLHKRLIEVAAKSPAKKRKVGAIIAQRNTRTPDSNDEDFIILSEGYNYNLDGGPCETEDNVTHPNVVHAEVAALENLPLPLHDSTLDFYTNKMYVTHPPCDGCKAALLARGLDYEVMGDFLKFDSAKPRVALVPPSLILGVAKVLTYGAKKYKANNWRKTPDIESYISALYRHMLAWQSGEETDPESGLHHLEHIACNVAFLLELKDLSKVRKEN
jgi:deoxycytidylate deaminase